MVEIDTGHYIVVPFLLIILKFSISQNSVDCLPLRIDITRDKDLKKALFHAFLAMFFVNLIFGAHHVAFELFGFFTHLWMHPDILLSFCAEYVASTAIGSVTSTTAKCCCSHSINIFLYLNKLQKNLITFMPSYKIVVFKLYKS